MPAPMSKAPAATAPAAAKVEPYIPASQSLPELTVGVLILGCILSVVLGAANAYLGMFAGMTVSASIPAAVISMAVLRFFGGNILQNNVVQTAAASGEGLASGVIFTVPALVLLGVWSKFSYIETTLIAGFGGILGVLFTIPLRRALIIEHPLQFPEGVATAEVLKVGAEGGGGIKLIMGAALIGAIGKLGSTGLKLWTDVAAWGTTAGKSALSIGINMSPALLGVGFIVGLNVAAVIFAGAVIDHWVAIPLFSQLGDATAIVTDKVAAGHSLSLAQVLDGASATDAADLIHKYATRYLGVGMMLVGGFWALFKLRKSLIGGIKAGLEAYKAGGEGGEGLPRTERDMPMNIILILIGVSVVPLFFIFLHFTDSVGISAVMAVVMLVAGFLFSAVASYMAGLVGSSNNPVSGITISTILVSALLLLAMGMKSPAGPVAAILIGGVVCCAAAIGGDNLQDLKCGQLVGSTPWKQQVMQILGVVIAAVFMAPILNLLNESYHIGSKHLPAPQAGLMASVSGGVFNGGLPWAMVGIGAAIAVTVIAIDVSLEKAGAKFRMPVMAFAVGAYLPFDLTLPIFLGGLIAHFVGRWLDTTGADPARRALAERNGLLAAAGLITGEALLGIVLAIPISAAQDENAIAMFRDHYANGDLVPTYADARIPGVILCIVVLGFMYWAATRREEKTK
jgi:putative OPT family oligopeptide transporter